MTPAWIAVVVIGWAVVSALVLRLLWVVGRCEREIAGMRDDVQGLRRDHDALRDAHDCNWNAQIAFDRDACCRLDRVESRQRTLIRN